MSRVQSKKERLLNKMRVFANSQTTDILKECATTLMIKASELGKEGDLSFEIIISTLQDRMLEQEFCDFMQELYEIE